jgi:type I restriction-modification system DNA methylase subunit
MMARIPPADNGLNGGGVAGRRPRATEVDAYVFIKENLKLRGWDSRNPDRSSGAGQVYTQNECLSHPVIREALGTERPENIVVVTEKLVWPIEAKRSHRELEKAIIEAEGYARKINDTKKLLVPFISGVAGNEIDGFLVHNRMLLGDKYLPITINDVETTALLSKSECEQLLRTKQPNLDNPPINERLFLSRAEHINSVLHLGAVNPHQRASVMAALLLSMIGETMPNIEERNASVLIGDINARVLAVLRSQKKEGFYDYTRIPLPSNTDNHVKFRQAVVDTIQELNNLNIRSAMNSGADWLGAFYEVFLKYASWAQDLGIVLTPRHLTRYVADVMDVRPNDVVYDPTCGTGGFLVAAFDSVKRKSNAEQLKNFKQYSVFGVEQDAGVASLAVVNMIFRGDGKNNIVEGNCFVKNLAPSTHDGKRTARFTDVVPTTPPVTKVMMNPPFALKRGEEKEYKFVDQALLQVEDGGILFSVLPYSTMVRPGNYKSWRKNKLLPLNTLLAVVTLPGDIFYPVGVTTVGVFIRKGVPHPPSQKVLWVRALSDGLLKSKGRRLPNNRAANDLATVHDALRAFIQNPDYHIQNQHQLIKACPIDAKDKLVELVPEAYLDQAEPNHEIVAIEAAQAMRDLLAFLIKTGNAVLSPELLSGGPAAKPDGNTKWKSFSITDLFQLKRGHFHSIANLDPGKLPTISRVSADNGLVGYFEKPTKAVIQRPGTLTVSTVTGDTFVQPVPFLATDNVLLCTPTEVYKRLRLTSLFFCQLMMNEVKWRYSYGRQCYRAKFATTKIMLPVTDKETLDEGYMARTIEAAPHWPLIRAALDKQQDRIGI